MTQGLGSLSVPADVDGLQVKPSKCPVMQSVLSVPKWVSYLV